MIKKSEITKNTYTIGEVAKMIGRTKQTLINWDNSGEIKFRRDPANNYRYLTREELLTVLDERGLLFNDISLYKRDIIYARVSSHKQKEDLERQVLSLIENNSDLKNVLILKEIGSGLNDKRKELLRLIDMVMNDEVNRIFITYKDRLTRFGYNYLEKVFKAKGVEIIVQNQADISKTIEEELVDDVMSLIASFSGKLYGLRSGRNKKNEKTLELTFYDK